MRTLTASSERGASTAGRASKYELVSATYRDKTYPGCLLLIDEARGEIELRQWTGRRKKGQATLAQLRLEPDIEVLVDGPLLRVSDLAISFESPAKAEEAADILRRPAKEREAAQGLSEAESAVTEFLVSREQALAFLSRMKADPREALLGAGSLWAADDKADPFDAVYSSYTARLAAGLEKMTTSLESAKTKLGPGLTERVYALAYTIGVIQNALFEGDFKQDRELAALQELGIEATTQDLQTEKPTERILTRAHPVLVGLATGQVLQE